MLQVFCDFDGTITSRDSIVFLTEYFGGGTRYRMDILEGIKAGTITVTEAIQKELETVKVSWDEARAALEANITVDPSFPEFVGWCREKGYPLKVVSSGMIPVVDFFIGDLGLERFAHPVEISADGWRYRRNRQYDKTVILAAAKNETPLVYVGDGTSDVAAIPYADILFAKSYLAEYCESHGVGFRPYTSFEDVRRALVDLDPSDPNHDGS